MPFRAKGTVFFQAVGGSVPVGWTETWYTADSNQDALISNLVNYVKVRKQLLGAGASIIAVRAADDTVPRATKIQEIVGNAGIGTIYNAIPADAFDPLQSDLLVRISAGVAAHRNFFLAGIPDSQDNQLDQAGINPAFIGNAAWKDWINFITVGSNFRIRFQPVPHVIPAQYALTTITDAVPRMMRKRNRGRPFFLFRGRR